MCWQNQKVKGKIKRENEEKYMARISLIGGEKDREGSK